MTVTLRSPIPARERILAFGGFGSGKTTNILAVAKRLADAHFHVIDSDGAFERMLSGANAALWSGNGGNVTVYPVFDWVEYTDALDAIQKLATPDDWIVIDMITPAWDAVQAHFTDQVFGKGLDQFFLEARMAAKRGSAFDGRKDWGTINRLYRNFANQLCLRSKCHVYATAGVAAVQDEDSKEIKALFGRYNVKPTGQKENGYRFHTVLWNTRSARGEWRITTIKDREREEVDGLVVGTAETGCTFASEYLQKIAGWKLARA